MGATRLDNVQNRGNDIISPIQHIIVPETQNAILMCAQPSVAALIVWRIGMLPAVKLDDDAQLQAREIGDKWSDRMLPSETEPCQLTHTQAPPKSRLGIGHVRSATASRISRARLLASLPPSQPSPASGERSSMCSCFNRSELPEELACAPSISLAPIPAFPRKRGKESTRHRNNPLPPPAGEGRDGGETPR